MKKTMIALALFCMTAGVYADESKEVAWERSAKEKCKKDMDDCKKDADQCNKDADMCKKKAKDNCNNMSKEQCQKQMDKCESNRNDCKEDMQDCKTDHDKCMNNTPKKDESSFSWALSDYGRSMWDSMTPDQKKKAMDMADKNKMSPDDAVMKVMGKK